MLVYLAAPYTEVTGDKDLYMKGIMAVAGEWMISHPDHHVVTPLIGHYMLHVPGVGTDWGFWERYSIDLLRRCDAILVVRQNWHRSVGVEAEMQIAKELNLAIF